MIQNLLIKKFYLFIFLICNIPFIAFAHETPVPSKQEFKGKYLFVQNADKAMVSPEKEHGIYTITLKNISPLVIYLSERPNRQTGQIEIQKFLKLWGPGSDSFKNDPPNAVLNSVHTSLFHLEKLAQYSFMLSKPIYNEKAKTLTYTAKALNGSAEVGHKKIMLKHVILFIDSVCLSCWNQ